MKRGFVTETHVVIYCDSCGDHYAEESGESTCFESVNQAVIYLNGQPPGASWRYDGDTVMCDACLATAHCAEHGHAFRAPRIPPRLLLNNPSLRTCTVCGISEIEALP